MRDADTASAGRRFESDFRLHRILNKTKNYLRRGLALRGHFHLASACLSRSSGLTDMDTGGKLEGADPSAVFGVSPMINSRMPPLAIAAWRNQSWLRAWPFRRMP